MPTYAATTSTTSRYATAAGRKVCWANSTIVELNGMLIDPCGPSTLICMPSTASNPASVMTKLGTPNWVYSTP